jgi:hypothetical protein
VRIETLDVFLAGVVIGVGFSLICMAFFGTPVL